MEAPLRLAGKRAIVTGGGKGIGRAISLALAGAGCDVVILCQADRTFAERTADEVRAIGVRCRVAVVDIASEAEVHRGVQEAIAFLGGLEILVNNAGTSRPAPLANHSAADWDHVMAVNVKGTLLMCQAALPALIASGGGSIVNIAAASAHRCFPNMGAYGPSKAAVLSLTQQMALEWAPHQIRVNAVSPGIIRTLRTERMLEENEVARKLLKHVPLARVGEETEVAGAVLYLVSPEAGYITGHALVVDGGAILTSYTSQ
jgi:NAD(P)-dependent dehydrogenase (short-subunit alcohol dehydrogenase family)